MDDAFEIRDCGTGHSFFRFIDDFWRSGVQRKVAHRVCTTMRKMGAVCVVIERLKVPDKWSPEVRKETEAIIRRLRGETEFEAVKLTFLDILARRDNLKAILDLDHALGYITLINVFYRKCPVRSYVFEGVIRELGQRVEEGGNTKWRPLISHYLHVKRVFECILDGHQYNLKGAYFAQQNGITSVCGHVCLSMMLNNVPDTTLHVSSEDLNERLGIDHVANKFSIKVKGANNENTSKSGLTLEDIKTLVEQCGYDFHLARFDGQKKPRFRQFLYSFIESDFPALLSFRTGEGDHVVAVAGHTLNSNSWFPLALKMYAADTGHVEFMPQPARYLPSLAWIDDFLVHDDNVGMQLSLPAHSFLDVDYAAEIPLFSPTLAVGILPTVYHVQILAHQAERCVAEYLTYLIRRPTPNPLTASTNYYVKHLLSHFDPRRNTAVLRTSLVSTAAYIVLSVFKKS